MKQVILFLFCILSVLYGKAQTTETEDKYPQTIVIKMIEISTNGAPASIESKMIIINTDNLIEKKALSDINYVNAANEGLESNALKLKIELQKWHNLGFSLKSSNVAAPTHYCLISTYVLQKN